MARRPQRSATTVLLAILAFVVVVAALKAASAVALPLVFAAFLIAVFWPLYDALAARVGRALAVLATLLALLAVGAGFSAALWAAASRVAADAHRYSDAWSRVGDRAAQLARDAGLSVDSLAGSAPAPGQLVESLARSVGSAATGITLAVAFFALGLLEVRAYGTRARRGSSQRYAELRALAMRVASNFQRYVLVRTFVGLITGVCVTIAAWLTGLDFPIIWGLVNFLLNYVPTLGSILGVVPPVLFALVQFESFTMAGVVLAVVGGVQLVMGNYVDPLVQGRYMRLSPVVVLLAVTFWGWVWGVAGALMAVPLTVLAVLICREFPSTRFIASMLASVGDDGADRPESAPASATAPRASPD